MMQQNKGEKMEFINEYFTASKKIIDRIDYESIQKTIELIYETREKFGRLFLIGVGGGAGHASHAVNDFRKIVGIESYSPSDNVSELTARINDEGWETSYQGWLKVSRLNANDLLFIFSVGGGNIEHKLSMNIVEAIKYATTVNAKITGIVGRDGGETLKLSEVCVLVPDVDSKLTTALTESFQAVIWHLIISHPSLYKNKMRWESTT